MGPDRDGADQHAVVEGRPDEADVVEMSAHSVGVVDDDHVAGDEVVDAVLFEPMRTASDIEP